MKISFPLCATALLWISSPYLLSQASQASQGDPSQKEVITSYEYQAFLNAASPHEELARIFYTDLLRKPGSQMDAALDSHFDLGSRDTYSPASKCSPALPHKPSQPPRRDQYEISGLESTAKNSSDYYEEKMAVN
jgi:hypothetical protein